MKDDPAASSNAARLDATKRLIEQQQTIKDTLVTRPIVSEKVSPEQQNRNYLLTRNDEYQIGALVEQYGMKRTIQMLKDGERRLQRREGG